MSSFATFDFHSVECGLCGSPIGIWLRIKTGVAVGVGVFVGVGDGVGKGVSVGAVAVPLTDATV